MKTLQSFSEKFIFSDKVLKILIIIKINKILICAEKSGMEI
jgi:hypothetical protein